MHFVIKYGNYNSGDYLSSTLTETHISNNYNNSTYDNLYL